MYRIGSLRYSNAVMYSQNQFIWSKEDITVLGVTIPHENIVEKNYKGICDKVKKVLNAWCNRGLSLMGKVLIINTLVASLFVYKMMVLPTIPQNTVKEIENIIRNYLWSGKKAKIALNILQNQKSDGGLNLVNLKLKDKALKATWPQILATEEDYAKLVYNSLRCNGLGHNIWRCTIHPQEIKNWRVTNIFWAQTLECWCEYNYYTQFRVENQVIWLNSYIRIKGKSFWWKDCYEKGLVYVHQLFEQQQIKTFESIQEEFGIRFMRYSSLISALPGDWKTFFKETPKSCFFPIPPHNFDRVTQKGYGSLSSEVYKYLSDDVMIIHNKYMKWREDLGENFSDGLLHYGRMHKELYSITNITKYRSFQYRLLQRALVTNTNLYRWGIKQSAECTFCGDREETIMHIMYECKKVQELWGKIKQYIEHRFAGEECHINPIAVITNKIVKRGHVGNFIALITKQFIYRQKCLDEPLSIDSLKGSICKIEAIEKYIAIKNGKLSTHLRKWGKQNQEGNQQENINNFIQQYLE